MSLFSKQKTNDTDTSSAEVENVSKKKKKKKKRSGSQTVSRKAPYGWRPAYSVQSQIQYEAMTKTGLCWLGGNQFSMSLALGDIDFVSQEDNGKAGLCEAYAKFLNTHLPDQHLQVSVVNRVIDTRDLLDKVAIRTSDDTFSAYRDDFNVLMADAAVSHGSTVVTDKYVTLRIEADSAEDAQTKLSRVLSADIKALGGVGGCQARVMNGSERLEVLSRLWRPVAPSAPFDYEDIRGQALTSKDYVAPGGLDMSDKNSITLLGGGSEKKWRVLVLRKLPPWLSDTLLSEITALPFELAISAHFDPFSQAESLKKVNRYVAELDMEREAALKKLAKQNLPADMLKHSLVESHEEASRLREVLSASNEKLYAASLVVGVAGRDSEELKANVERVRQVASGLSCELEDLTYMQLDGLNALSPIGVNRLPYKRLLTTAASAVLVPFTSQDVMHDEGVFYGTNTSSGNLIYGDRWAGGAANGFVLGKTGAGKSQFAKAEIMQRFLRSGDEILIIDPEREYKALAEHLGAARAVISAGSEHCVNALALDMDAASELEGTPVRAKASFVLSLLETLIGGTYGLAAEDRSVIDRAAMAMYQDFVDGALQEQPTLATLHEYVKRQPDANATSLATRLELYAIGSASGFARQTNVDLSSRVVVYDTADLSEDMQTFGMMIVLEDIWARIVRNRKRGIRTWVYADEFHLWFKNKYASEYFRSMWARVRKYGAAMTGLTQNVEAVLAHEDARIMLANSPFLVLLGQSETDGAALADLLGLTTSQYEAFMNVAPGNGLLRIAGTTVGFENQMDRNSQIYRLFSTDHRNDN